MTSAPSDKIRHARDRADAHPPQAQRPSIRLPPEEVESAPVDDKPGTDRRRSCFCDRHGLAADVSTPVVCGSDGCRPLPTSTLHGLLTLPEALRPADPPPAQPFLLFRVADPDGATHEVVYVPRDGGALLGFAGAPRWRLVPADDAKLLVDAAAGATPYPHLPPARRSACCSPPRSIRWSDGPWALLAALLGLGVLGVAAYAASPRFPVDSGNAPRGEIGPLMTPAIRARAYICRDMYSQTRLLPRHVS